MKASIDERLAEVIRLINEKEKNNFLIVDSKDKQKINETINYLKDYAKIQAVSKAISNQEGLKDDIEEAKNNILKLIEEKKLEIAHLPKVNRKKKKVSGLYGYENELAEFEENRIKKEAEQRKEKISLLKQELKIYQNKIKKLDSLGKTLSNPSKVAEQLFPEQQMNIKENYKNLVNMCAMTIANDDLAKKELIGDDKVFKFDGKDYSINYNNAKKFISLLKSKKEIVTSAEYLQKKGEYENVTQKLEDANKNKTIYKNAFEKAESDEFKYICEKMNEISKQYRELDEQERIVQRGNIFTRARNGLRRMVGLNEKLKVPKYIQDSREKLADTISELTNKIKLNDNFKNTFDEYLAVRKNMGEGYRINLEMLENVPYKLRIYGCISINCIPRNTVKASELQIIAKRRERESELLSEKLNNEKETLEKETTEMYSKLNNKAKKMINDEKNRQTILSYAQRYYGINDDRKKMQKNGTNLSASAAVLILEGILGKRNIPMENIFKYYKDVIGIDNLKDETVDINKMIYTKLDSLKEQIISSSTEQKKEEKVNER